MWSWHCALFLAVFGCSWFDHVKTWHSHKEDMNMLFITYEEMIQVGTQIISIVACPHTVISFVVIWVEVGLKTDLCATVLWFRTCSLQWGGSLCSWVKSWLRSSWQMWWNTAPSTTWRTSLMPTMNRCQVIYSTTTKEDSWGKVRVFRASGAACNSASPWEELNPRAVQMSTWGIREEYWMS